MPGALRTLVLVTLSTAQACSPEKEITEDGTGIWMNFEVLGGPFTPLSNQGLEVIK